MSCSLLVLPWDGQGTGLAALGTMPLGRGTVASAVHDAARAASIPVIDTLPSLGNALVIPGGSALGPRALDGMRKAGVAAQSDLRFSLGGAVGELLSELRGDACCGAYLHGVSGESGSALSGRIAAATAHIIEGAEYRVPEGLVGDAPLVLSDHLALPIRHWLDLLWAHLLGLGPELFTALVGRNPISALLRLGWAAARARSLDPMAVASRLLRCGSGVRIHPTAVVEACALGDNVHIGAHAVVRYSILGPEAVVEDLAVCEGAVLGPGARVQRQAMVKFSVLGADSAVGGAIQLGVMGTGSGLKRGSYLMDQQLGGAVRVRRAGALVPAPLGMAGVCVGENTQIGSGVWVAPGRVLGPDLQIAGDDALRNPQTPGPGTYVVRAGRLEPPS